MMRRYLIERVSLCVGVGILFSGCGLAPLLSVPPMPTFEPEVIRTAIEWKKEYNLDDEIAVLKGHRIPERSSVVLNVPSKVFDDQSKEKQIGASKADDEFTTKAFFNIAEQQIERGLLNSGFKVISRAKFEAKLRDLRDGAKKCTSWGCYYDKAAPELKVLMDDVKDKYERKIITDDEYIQKVAYFKEKLNDDLGSKRDDGAQELTDIAEVIRAASSAGVKADYILQINEFNSNKRDVVEKNLNEIDEVRDLMQKHPSANREFANQNMIRCAVTSAVLNAKLIHVATGEIVWLGENRLNEYTTKSGLNYLTISIGVNKSVANESEVRGFVRRNNTELAREQREGLNTQVPDWTFNTTLIPATQVAGICRKEWIPDKDKSMKLAREVAKELIKTIKTVSKEKNKYAPQAVAKTPKETKEIVENKLETSKTRI